MKQYHDLLNKIINYGDYKPPARENMPGTYSLFGPQMEFGLRDGFPIVTTKKVSFKNIVVELLWFLKGFTNVKYLVENNCNIWTEDAYSYYCKKMKTLDDSFYENKRWHPMDFSEFVEIIKNNEIESSIPNYKLGDCGKQYGWLWREWSGDQFKSLIEGLRNSPDSRRHIISAWNPETLKDMALNTCHSFVQFNCVKLTHEQREYQMWSRGWGYPPSTNKMSIEEIDSKYFMYYDIPKYYLDCKFTMRSNDFILGNPYNVSSYALLTNIIGKMCNMIPRNLVFSGGDIHVYENHLDAAKEQLTRDPDKYPLPKVQFTHDFNLNLISYQETNNLDQFIDGLEPSMFSLDNYQSYPSIKAELSTGITK